MQFLYTPSGNKHAACTQFFMTVVFVMVIDNLLHNQNSIIYNLLLLTHIVTCYNTLTTDHMLQRTVYPYTAYFTSDERLSQRRT